MRMRSPFRALESDMTSQPALKRSFFYLMLLILALAGTRGAVADAPDFTLLDEQGQAVKLHYHRLASAIVLMSHRSDSRIAGPAALLAGDAIARHPGLQIPFFLINADAGQTRAEIQESKRLQGLSAPVLLDDTGLVTATLAFSYVGEVLVINPRN